MASRFFRPETSMMAEDNIAIRGTYKAAIVVRTNSDYKFQIKTLQIPELDPTDVLVKLSVTGICGSDYSLASGIHGPTCEILGHEGIGRVVKLGLTKSEIKIGQLVGVSWQRDVCGLCCFCLVDGGETRCAEQVTSGRKVDGTFAEYTVVSMRYIIPIPEGLPHSSLAPILCGGVTMYKALKISGARAGQWVIISGAGGGVGALGIQFAKAMGFQVVAIDVGEEKEALCLKSGADVYIDTLGSESTAAAVWRVTENRGANAVLVTAGSGKAYQDGLTLLAPFGTLVCVGIPPPSETVTFHPLDFINNGHRVIGSAIGTRGDVLEAINFVSRGLVTPLVNIIDLESLPEISERFKLGKLIGKYVIRLSNESSVEQTKIQNILV